MKKNLKIINLKVCFFLISFLIADHTIKTVGTATKKVLSMGIKGLKYAKNPIKNSKESLKNIKESLAGKGQGYANITQEIGELSKERAKKFALQSFKSGAGFAGITGAAIGTYGLLESGTTISAKNDQETNVNQKSEDIEIGFSEKIGLEGGLLPSVFGIGRFSEEALDIRLKQQGFDISPEKKYQGYLEKTIDRLEHHLPESFVTGALIAPITSGLRVLSFNKTLKNGTTGRIINEPVSNHTGKLAGVKNWFTTFRSPARFQVNAEKTAFTTKFGLMTIPHVIGFLAGGILFSFFMDAPFEAILNEENYNGELKEIEVEISQEMQPTFGSLIKVDQKKINSVLKQIIDEIILKEYSETNFNSVNSYEKIIEKLNNSSNSFFKTEKDIKFDNKSSFFDGMKEIINKKTPSHILKGLKEQNHEIKTFVLKIKRIYDQSNFDNKDLIEDTEKFLKTLRNFSVTCTFLKIFEILSIELKKTEALQENSSYFGGITIEKLCKETETLNQEIKNTFFISEKIHFRDRYFLLSPPCILALMKSVYKEKFEEYFFKVREFKKDNSIEKDRIYIEEKKKELEELKSKNSLGNEIKQKENEIKYGRRGETLQKIAMDVAIIDENSKKGNISASPYDLKYAIFLGTNNFSNQKIMLSISKLFDASSQNFNDLISFFKNKFNFSVDKKELEKARKSSSIYIGNNKNLDELSKSGSFNLSKALWIGVGTAAALTAAYLAKKWWDNKKNSSKLPSQKIAKETEKKKNILLQKVNASEKQNNAKTALSTEASKPFSKKTRKNISSKNTQLKSRKRIKSKKIISAAAA